MKHIFIFLMAMGMSTILKAQITEAPNGSVGIGTTAPNGALHVVSTVTSANSIKQIDANLVVEGKSGTRATDQGASLGFVVPANTNGSNFWQQGRVLVTPDNTANANASGKMHLQTRFLNSSKTAWHWRDNLVLRSSGNVGIGTATPSSTIDVNGKATVNSLKIDGGNTIATVNGFLNKIEFTGGQHGAIVFHPGKSDELMFGFHTNGVFYWGTGRSATQPDYYAMQLDGDKGDLGIRGTFTADKVKVKVRGWADYVFNENYNLPTLQQVEDYIKQKGHLINIPSATDVTKNGVDLGEMDKNLLEKIEELTLYTIQQQKEIEVLKTLVKQLLTTKNK